MRLVRSHASPRERSSLSRRWVERIPACQPSLRGGCSPHQSASQVNHKHAKCEAHEVRSRGACHPYRGHHGRGVDRVSDSDRNNQQGQRSHEPTARDYADSASPCGKGAEKPLGCPLPEHTNKSQAPTGGRDPDQPSSRDHAPVIRWRTVFSLSCVRCSRQERYAERLAVMRSRATTRAPARKSHGPRERSRRHP